jgi:hypothetical protein
MRAPEELERGNGDQEAAAARRAGHVVRQQPDIVVDVLEDIHQQHEIGVAPIDGSPEVNGLARGLAV